MSDGAGKNSRSSLSNVDQHVMHNPTNAHCATENYQPPTKKKDYSIMSFVAIDFKVLTIIDNVIHRNLKLTNSHLFSPTLKNYIITTTHHKNEILDGDEFYVLEVLIQRLFTC